MSNDVATTLLQDPDPTARRTAIEELRREAQFAEIQDAAIEALVAALHDSHMAVQDAASRALRDCNPETVAARVLPLLQAAAQPRSVAIEVLQQLGPQAVGPLLHAAPNSNPHIRKCIADIVGHIGGRDALNGLLIFLDDPCPNVRSAAAEWLGTLGERRAVEPLIALMQDEEEWVVFSAITALGNLRDVRAIPALRDLLAADAPTIQCAVVEALGKVGDSEVIPDLLEMLPMAGLPLRHFLFVTIVELVGEKREIFRREEMQDFLFSELVAALKTREPEVQLAALRGLRLLGNSLATAALLQFLATQQHAGDAILAAALDTLTEIGDEEHLLRAAQGQDEGVALLSIQALSSRRASRSIPILGELVAQSDNREVRRAAIVALGRIGTAGVEAAVVAALQDQTGYVRAEAARIVAERNIQEAEPVLWKRIDEESYPDVVAEHVRAIVNLSERKSIGTLERLLDHHRAEIREAVVTHWKEPLSQSVKAVFERHLHDPDWRVRLKIVERLSGMEDESVPEGLRAVSTDPHPFVRQAVMQALGRWAGPESCSILRKAAREDSDAWVRSRAVEQLAALRDRTVVPLFIEALEHAPPLLQQTIACALGTLGDPSAVEALRRLQAGAEPEVQHMAAHALAQLQCSVSGPGAAV